MSFDFKFSSRSHFFSSCMYTVQCPVKSQFPILAQLEVNQTIYLVAKYNMRRTCRTVFDYDCVTQRFCVTQCFCVTQWSCCLRCVNLIWYVLLVAKLVVRSLHRKNQHPKKESLECVEITVL
jgi:hypothetical protein